MEMIGFSLASLVQFVGSVSGYMWALRAGRSRGQIVLAAALGGMPAGFALAFPFVKAGAGVAGLFYVGSSAIMGACIGVAGLVARAIGAWLNQRPE